MAPIVRGSEVQYRFKKVTAVEETPSGGDYQSFHAYSETFQPGEGLVDDDELGGARHNAIDPTQQVSDLPNPSGGMQVALDLNQIGFWLTSMWGAPTTDNADDPVYEHVWESGGDTPELVTIEVPFASAFVKAVDAHCVSQMNINFAPEGGIRRVDMTMVGRSVRRLAAALSATTTAAPARDKMSGWAGLVKINGTNFGNVLGGQVQMGNGAFAERYLNDTEWPSGIEIGRPSFQATPQIRVRSDAAGMLDLFDGVTPFTFELLFQKTADKLLRFYCPNVVAPKVLPSAAQIGGLDVSPTFMASQTDAAPMLTVTARNAVAAY